MFWFEVLLEYLHAHNIYLHRLTVLNYYSSDTKLTCFHAAMNTQLTNQDKAKQRILLLMIMKQSNPKLFDHIQYCKF